VVVGAELEPPRKALDRPLEVTVVKWDDASTRIAEQVMVVLAAGIDELVTRAAIPELKMRDQPVLSEQLEDAIDARARYRLLASAQLVLDLDRGERAGLTGEQVDQGVSGPRLAVSGLVKHPSGVCGPLPAVWRRHGVDSIRAPTILRLVLVTAVAQRASRALATSGEGTTTTGRSAC
jgi:hypothetical protein